MEWSRTDVLSLAHLSCSACGGEGKKREKEGRIIPCSCVLRAVFRACYARFRVSARKEKYLSRVSFEHVGGKERRLMWSRKDEEYIADFHLVSRRALDPFHYRLFSYHFLLGADWKLCCRRLGIDRGSFFHAVYRVQETLGRVFYELEPYALYPPREYFATRLVHRESPRAVAGRLFSGGAGSGPGPAGGPAGNLAGSRGETPARPPQGRFGGSYAGQRSGRFAEGRRLGLPPVSRRPLASLAFPQPGMFLPAGAAPGAFCRAGT